MKLPRDQRIVITGHTNPDADSLISSWLLADFLRWQGYDCRIYVAEVTEREGLRAAEHLGLDWTGCRTLPEEDEVLFLVDHHVPAFDRPVVGCIDHHPCQERYDYPIYQNLRASSTARIIFRLMEEAGMPLTKHHRELAASSVWLDTQAMKSSKFCPEDGPWVLAETEALGLDKDWLEREGLGLMDLTLPMEELVVIGMKKYTIAGKSVWSGGLRCHPLTEDVMARAIAVSEGMRRDNGVDLWLVLMSDPVAGRTEEADLTDSGVVRYSYPRLMSRSMDIMPRVERELNERK